MEREKEASNGDWKLNFKEFYSLILTSYLGAPIDIHFQSNEHRSTCDVCSLFVEFERLEWLVCG